MKESSKYKTNLETIFKDFCNIVIIVKDNYNFNYLNRMGINLLGYRKKEILEMSFIELLTPDSLENCINSIRSLRKTSFSQPFVINIIKKNGEILSLELTGIKLDDGRFFFTARNLSLERHRKEKLNYLEELNKNILNSIGEGIVVLDTRGCIVNINEFVERKFQWDKSKILGQNVFELYPDLKEQGLLDSFVSIVDKGTYESKTNIMRMRADGKKLILNFRGYPLKTGTKITGVVTIMQDVTQSKEISDRIKRSANFREKVQRITSSLMPLNNVDKIIKCLSNGLKNDLGYERGAIFLVRKGQKTPVLTELFSSINPEDEISKAKDRILEGIKRGKGLSMDVFRNAEPKIFSNADKEKNNLRVFPDTLSEMIVPIKIQKASIGVITIDSRSYNTFDDTDLKFVEMLSVSVAMSIGKTRLYEDLIEKLRSLSIFFETSKMLQTNQESVNVFPQVLKHLSQNLPDYSSIVLKFNNNKASILASFNATEQIKATISTMTAEVEQSLIKKIGNGNQTAK